MTREEMEVLGWDALDVLLVSGDAYVDHPAFGVALLGRWLVAHGYRTGIVAQPRWDTPEDVQRLGRPRLFAGITAGALDSMLAHYTAFRKKRSDDAYTPGGRHGARPNRACIVYTSLVRQAFPGLPVVLGGIEASLRRATHYDFWTDKVRRPILLDSKADLVVYGMGERAVLEAAERLQGVSQNEPRPSHALHEISGTVFATSAKDDPYVPHTQHQPRSKGKPPFKSPFEGGFRGMSSPDAHHEPTLFTLPSHEAILANPKELMDATLALEQHVHHAHAYALQQVGDRRVVVAPPAQPLSTAELDKLYALPYTRRPHPSYTESIPAAEMIQFSVTSHRGCGGGCSFCSLALHQGRRIRSRSAASLRREVQAMTQHPDWKGSLTDVGGPTANMWGARCTADPAACKRRSCLTPQPCPHFKTKQAELGHLLEELRVLPGVTHVRVSSGIRHDLALQDADYVRRLLDGFVGGQLKLAPEHRCANVLRLMRKAPFKAFEEFLTVFERESKRTGKEQYVIPYLMSAFPGCTLEDMRRLARWLQERGWKPRQVQCFIPTPGTVATAMYFARIDPDGKPIPVARSDKARLEQHHVLIPAQPGAPRRGHRPR